MSCDSRATIARQSRDIFSKLDRNSRICRINVYSMRLQRESCVYIINLCREIIANYSRTSLQLSQSIEIGKYLIYKLVSHFFSRLFCEFVADFRTTFVRVSRECRESFHMSRTCLKILCDFFSPKHFARLSCDGRATFVRVSRTCRREILVNLQCEIFATLERM